MNINRFYGDDNWDMQRRRPSPHHFNSDYRDGFLDPGFASQLHRSRSHGRSPAPQINLYNINREQEGSPIPPPYPPSRGSRRASPRSSPESRGRGLSPGAWSAIEDMALDHRYRSRSRGRSDASSFDRPPNAYMDWQLAQRDVAERARLEQERWKYKMKLDDLEAKSKRDREEDEARRREKQIVEDYERKQREKKEEAEEAERKLRDKLEREKKEAKEREQKAYEDFKRKEQEEKDEKERKYKEFLREQKEREEKKKREEKEAEDKFQSEMRKRLANLGYTAETIDILVDEEKAKKFKNGVRQRPDQLEVWRGAPRAPVYPKVHRDYLAVETLKYYDLPWEYDRVRHLPRPPGVESGAS